MGDRRPRPSTTDDEDHSPTLTPLRTVWGELRPQPSRTAARRALTFASGGDSDDSDETDDDSAFLFARRSIKQRSTDLQAQHADHPRSPRPTVELEIVDADSASENDLESVPAAAAAEGTVPEESVSLDALSADVLCLLVRALDLPGALSFSSTCRHVHSAAMADASAWAAHAHALGVCPHRHADTRALHAAMRDGYLLRAGDCLEVRDTFGLWAAARVVGVVDDLLLVHFEGYSKRWVRARASLSRACRTSRASRFPPILVPPLSLSREPMHGAVAIRGSAQLLTS